MGVADNNLQLKASGVCSTSTAVVEGTAVDFGGPDKYPTVVRLNVTSTGVNTDTELIVTIEECDTEDGRFVDAAVFEPITGNAGEGVYHITHRFTKRYRRCTEQVSGDTASTFTTQIDIVPQGRYNSF